MVFGVFDTLHEGHIYFLTEAAEKYDRLIVVVTLPEIVFMLKKRHPKQSLETRMAAITSFNPSFQVVPGDQTLGEWNVIKMHAPDIVFLGHDQHGIATELERLGIPFEFIGAYKPEVYKSSLM
jgi:cytidyltransferase-like protein